MYIYICIYIACSIEEKGWGLSESVKKGKFVTKIFFPDS